MTSYSKAVPILFGCLAATQATAEVYYNEIGKKAYAQWDCAAFAALTDEHQQEGLKLFNSGYEKLVLFVEAGRASKLNSDNTNEVPVGILWNLTSGPSADFSIGYMWYQFLDNAEEETADADSDLSYDLMMSLKAEKASQIYRKKNCELLLD
ncbi:hypothetical protein [Ruegeria sp. R14_0]|uniref:hypothetical protein n=1 Tax=Ruegeria sp. R14_0 TaxID=2821100 RepID=UPI001ADB383C|nr:hypothetical protein [Ruegeria sp. R14_0]MBO9448022.1 hypothetical protein [Ruegeria sp. R14_0]